MTESMCSADTVHLTLLPRLAPCWIWLLAVCRTDDGFDGIEWLETMPSAIELCGLG